MGFSEIIPGLSQGSAPPIGSPLPFDVVVLCANEYQPPPGSFGKAKVRSVGLDDSGPPPTKRQAQDAIVMASNVTRDVHLGRDVLVTCWMGLNRSGLVSALTLVNLGYSSDRAVSLVRKARGVFALSNRHFVKLIQVHEQMVRRKVA